MSKKDKASYKKQINKKISWKEIVSLILQFLILNSLLWICLVFFIRNEEFRNWKHSSFILMLLVIIIFISIQFLPIEDTLKPLIIRIKEKIVFLPLSERLTRKIFLLEKLRKHRKKDSSKIIIVYLFLISSWIIITLSFYINHPFFDTYLYISPILGFFIPIIGSIAYNRLIVKSIIVKRNELCNVEVSSNTFVKSIFNEINTTLPKLESIDLLTNDDIRFNDGFNKIKYLRIKHTLNYLLQIGDKNIQNLVKRLPENMSSENKQDNMNLLKSSFVNYFRGRNELIHGISLISKNNEYRNKFEKAIDHFNHAYFLLRMIKDKKISIWAYHFKTEVNFIKHLLDFNYNQKLKFLRQNKRMLKKINRSLWYNDNYSQSQNILYKSYIFEVKASKVIQTKYYGTKSISNDNLVPIITDLINRQKQKIIQIKRREITQQIIKVVQQTQEEIKADEAPQSNPFIDVLYIAIMAILGGALVFIFGEYYTNIILQKLLIWQQIVYFVLPLIAIVTIIYLLNERRKKRKKSSK